MCLARLREDDAAAGEKVQAVSLRQGYRLPMNSCREPLRYLAFSFSFLSSFLSSFFSSVGWRTGWTKCVCRLSVVRRVACSSASLRRGYSYVATHWCELLNTPQTMRMRTILAVRERGLALGLATTFFFFTFFGASSSSS